MQIPSIPTLLAIVYLVGLVMELRHVPRLVRIQMRAVELVAKGAPVPPAWFLMAGGIITFGALVWPVSLPLAKIFGKRLREVKFDGVRIGDAVDPEDDEETD